MDGPKGKENVDPNLMLIDRGKDVDDTNMNEGTEYYSKGDEEPFNLYLRD